jgi:glycosyltransferase 2 family protein
MNGASAAAVLASLESAADRFVALDIRFVLLALAFQLVNLALRSLALRNVIAASYPEKRVSAWTVGGAYAAGVALNAFAPARGGEALKIALLRLRIAGSSVPTLVSAGGLLTALDAVIGATLIGSFLGLGLLPSLPSPRLPSATVTPSYLLLAGGIAVVVAAAALFAAGPLARRARWLWLHVRKGGAILRTPGRYVRQVVLLQLGGWACRTGVALCVLAAFGLPATVPLALLVVVAGGLSTLVPTPGGAGTQQVLLVYALQQTASTSAALSFSVGMQVGITTVNTLIGLSALMLMFGTVRPTAAVRAARRAAGAL